MVQMGGAQRALYESQLQRAREEGAGRNGLSQKSMTALFAALRKAANHPCLLRSHYTDDDLKSIAAVAKAAGAFGERATERMVRDEIGTYSDFQIHQLCADLPPLRARVLPAATLLASAKMAALATLLPELADAGHRVLIFSQVRCHPLP